MENKKNEKQRGSKSRMMALTVKAIVLNEKNEMLILKRATNDKTNPGRYDLPGGHIEENESFKDTMIREIKEETGLKAIFGDVVDVVEFPKENLLFKDDIRGIRCICYVDSSEVKLSHEHDEYEWISLDMAAEKFSEKDGFENEKRETILKAKKYLEMKNSLAGWQRTLADFENYKKRQAEDRASMIAFSNLNLILEILPVLDNFHMSTDHIPEDQKENSWVVGIMHIQKQLEKILEDNGIAEIKIKEGDEFNPMEMEAIRNEEDEKKEKKNTVKKVLIKGYKMGGRVIRATKVIVG